MVGRDTIGIIDKAPPSPDSCSVCGAPRDDHYACRYCGAEETGVKLASPLSLSNLGIPPGLSSLPPKALSPSWYPPRTIAPLRSIGGPGAGYMVAPLLAIVAFIAVLVRIFVSGPSTLTTNYVVLTPPAAATAAPSGDSPGSG